MNSFIFVTAVIGLFLLSGMTIAQEKQANSQKENQVTTMMQDTTMVNMMMNNAQMRNTMMQRMMGSGQMNNAAMTGICMAMMNNHNMQGTTDQDTTVSKNKSHHQKYRHK